MKYFFDNCISFRLAHMLAALNVEAIALRDQFRPDIEDLELSQLLAGQELVFVTNDAKQKKRQHEALALKQAGLTAIFLGRFWTNLDFWQQAVWLVPKWPRISGFADGVAMGTCAEIKQNGKAHVFQL